MIEPRLKTSLRVDAIRRLCDSKVLMLTVYARGDDDRGGLILRISRGGDRVDLYEQGHDPCGGRVWRRLNAEMLDERSSAEKLQKRRRMDSDLWIVDIEDPWGDFALDAPVIDV